MKTCTGVNWGGSASKGERDVAITAKVGSRVEVTWRGKGEGG